MPVNAAATSASGPGPLASPIGTGNTSTPALNSTSCYAVNANGTVSTVTNSTLSLPGVPEPSPSLTKVLLPSAWPGQINATNATTVWFNSSVFCVQHPATQTATPSTSLTSTTGSAGHHALNTSETRLTKTSTVSTTSSLHPISPKSSRVPVTSSTRVVLVTPSSRVVSSSSPPATPECSPPAHTKSASSSPSSRTSARSTVVEPDSPSPPPAHTTTRPSPAAPGAPKSPNTVSPARPAVPSSAPVTVPKESPPVFPTESFPTAPGAPESPNTVFPTDSFPTAPGAPELPGTISPVLPAVPSSASVTTSNTLSSVAPFPPTSVTGPPTGFPTGLGTSKKPQSTHSTITSTVTETPQTTFSTPVSITETTDGHVTITAPPLITTTEQSSLSDGTVVTVTHVIANPPKQAVSASSKDTFFGNHAAVVGVFLAAGFTLAGLVLLAFCCFRRRRRRQAQHRGSRLPEISHPRPIQSPFADVTGNPAVRERASPNVRWHGFMQPRGPASTSHSSISSPLNRSEEDLPAAHRGAPVPPPPVQRAASRSSYRIPVPYADVVAAHGNENRRFTGVPGEYLQTQPSDVPPRLPMRSPLRLLAAHNMAKIPRDNALNLSLSRASTPSVYPPSLHRPDVDVDVDADSPSHEKEVVASAPLQRVPSGWLTRGLSYGTKSGQGHKVDSSAESHGAQTGPVDSDGTPSLAVSASSSSHAHYSPLESPASDTGTAFTSIQEGNSPQPQSLPATNTTCGVVHAPGRNTQVRREAEPGILKSTPASPLILVCQVHAARADLIRGRCPLHFLCSTQCRITPLV
ncbi:hypothetical protein EDB89DRAFT_968314 [Lactarius sanguifluus]|nr:hypothetical protein EDB89DRAFT_968314 [Lactarius sanguifluus]